MSSPTALPPQAPAHWEGALAELLNDLAAVQSELLALLSEKRARMLEHDREGMTALDGREAELSQRLERCHERRREMLDAAGREGLPSGSMQQLAASVAPHDRVAWQRRIDGASHSLRLLQHECLTNFVLAQRTWLHLSQLLEIIATGGRMHPTYGKGDAALARGSLVDEAA